MRSDLLSFGVVRIYPDGRWVTHRQLAAIVSVGHPGQALQKLREELPHVFLRAHEVFEVRSLASCDQEQVRQLLLLDQMALVSGLPGYLAV